MRRARREHALASAEVTRGGSTLGTPRRVQVNQKITQTNSQPSRSLEGARSGGWAVARSALPGPARRAAGAARRPWWRVRCARQPIGSSVRDVGAGARRAASRIVPGALRCETSCDGGDHARAGSGGSGGTSDRSISWCSARPASSGACCARSCCGCTAQAAACAGSGRSLAGEASRPCAHRWPAAAALLLQVADASDPRRSPHCAAARGRWSLTVGPCLARRTAGGCLRGLGHRLRRPDRRGAVDPADDRES